MSRITKLLVQCVVKLLLHSFCEHKVHKIFSDKRLDSELTNWSILNFSRNTPFDVFCNSFANLTERRTKCIILETTRQTSPGTNRQIHSDNNLIYDSDAYKPCGFRLCCRKGTFSNNSSSNDTFQCLRVLNKSVYKIQICM